MKYDPNVAPDVAQWLGASEAQRLDAVLRFHEGERAGSLRLHAAFHVTVETQIAEGMGASVRAVERLVAQGLDRHEAVHAMGAVVAEEVYGALKEGSFDAARYEARLDALTAEHWHSGK